MSTTGRGLLELTGPQRIWFLQQTITTDVEELPSGRWVESCFLSPKGKLQSHFRVGVVGDSVWIDVDPPTTADLADWFVKYRFRTKVEVNDRTSASAVVIDELAAPGEVTVPADGTVVFGDRLGDTAIAVVHGPLPSGVEAASEQAFDRLRIEAGEGAFGVDYTSDNLPQEAGLTRAVSVEKGCYVGQETIARIHFRGHINKVVRPLTFDGVEPPDAIGRSLTLEGRKLGSVTSAVHSPSRGDIGLGMVSVEPATGEVLEVEGGGTATVGAIPAGTKTTKG